MGRSTTASEAMTGAILKHSRTADLATILTTLFVESWHVLTAEQRTRVLINADRTLALNAEQIAQDNTE